MPKVSEQYLEARRDALLDAAEAAIAREGLHGATLAAIKREAGASSGAVYHYFRSKDDIVASIRERHQALDEAAYRAARADPSPRSALFGLVDAGIELNHDSPGNQDARLAVMLWAEALINERVMATQLQLMAPWWDTAAALLERAIAEGEVDPAVDVEAVAALLAAISLGATVLEAWEPGRVPVDRLVRAARRLLEAGL